ncbi:MAG: ABC transporter permease subunit [Oscillospiraceae bacterium]|jgi:putative aldouronate transport system permease protein|nr:ABC transporter permease subunit [Oscillospiraceae bacterium]
MTVHAIDASNGGSAGMRKAWKSVAALSILMIISGAAWYITRAGVIGNKDWDFAAYGRGPALLITAGAALLIANVAAYFFLPSLRTYGRPLWLDLKRDRYMYLLILPGILVVFLFSYLPMYGVILAFKEYKIKSGIVFSQWVGLQNFNRFFGRSVSRQVIGNTLFIGVTQLLVTFPVPIILALLLNELRSHKYRRVIQSVIYLPHFISWVIVYTLLFSLFSMTSGMVSKMLVSMGLQPLNVLTNPNGFYGLLYMSSIWKEAGWGTIIFMAAITGVDQQMYEASYLDGANRFQQCVHITLPAIAFSITTMLILNVGSVMGANFDQIMNLRTDATKTTVAQVIDTYIYDMGVEKGQYDLSTAIGLFQQVINCILLFASNMVVQRTSGEGFF